MPGEQADALREILLTLLPVLLTQTDNGTLSPDAAIVRVYLQTLVERLDGIHGILLQHIDLTLYGIGSGIMGPATDHRVYLSHRMVIILVLDQTEDTVVPVDLILWIIAQGTVIVADSLSIFLLIDPAERPHLIGTGDIGIALDGLRAV